VRVLLDEQLPRQLARELIGHEIRTVQQQGWAGLTNGDLLQRAAEAGYEVFITADQNIEFQQNLAARKPIREKRTSASLVALGLRRSFHRTSTQTDYLRNELASFRLSGTTGFRRGGSSLSIWEVPFTLTCLVLIGRQSRCLILSMRSEGMCDVMPPNKALKPRPETGACYFQQSGAGAV